MQALVYEGIGKPLSLQHKPIPKAGAGELVLRVKACGICGSDIHAAQTEFAPIGTVMGHEFSGEVSEIGPGVEGWALGDKAIGIPMWFCGECESCKSGDRFACGAVKYIGLQDDADGAFANYVRIQAQNALKLANNVDVEVAALWEPLAVAYKGIKRAKISTDDNVLIVGGGAIGLSLAIVAKSLGVKQIGLSEIQPERLRRSAQCGATVVIDAAAEADPVAAFTEQTGSVPNVIFECVGLPGMFQRIIDMAPLGAHVVVMGACLEPEQFSVVSAGFKNLTCSFSIAYDQEEVDFIIQSLAAGTIEPSPLISKRTGIQGLSDTFEHLKQPNSECKVLVCPEEDVS